MSIKLLLVKGDKGYDISELVESVTWSGKHSSATRSIKVSLLDDPGFSRTRSEIDVEQGHQCVFYWKDQKLFQGMFVKQEQNQSKKMTVTAYDNGIYLANNKDTFNYTNKKASEIFVDVCKRFGIPYGSVADTLYQIPELPKPKTTAYDVICDALSLTYETTGVRYYPLCVGDEIRLLERRANVLQWVLETGVNLEEYNLTKSIEKVKTRVKLLSKEGTVLAEAIDSALEKKLGSFQDVDTADDTLNAAQLNELAKTTLGESNTPERSFNITCLGIPDVITGVAVYVIVKELGVSKTYYVEEDTHTFEGKSHHMKVKFAAASDIISSTIVG